MASHNQHASQIVPPVFSTTGAPPMSASTAAAVSAKGTPATLNLDELFSDYFFTAEGEMVFPSEHPENVRQNIISSHEVQASTYASRPVATAPGTAVPQPTENTTNTYAPVPYAGGISTTGLHQPHTKTTAMGPAAPITNNLTPNPVPFQQTPQQRHHLPFATTNITAPPQQPQSLPQTASTSKKKTGSTNSERKMSDQQKSERRERNREHAKRSRIRKKFLLESLQQSVSLLKEENEKLRSSVRKHLGDSEADVLLQKENLEEAAQAAGSLIANSNADANKVLDDPDFSFIKALQTAQQNFVVTDPSLPDNPIVYATQGFLNLTGYTLDQVLGRNCRFLQGPETDPKAVEKIRQSIEQGTDMSVCLLNYRVDGTTFWNQFFIAALRDAAGNITNYVGVQCKVSDQYAANICKKQEEEDSNDTNMSAANKGAAVENVVDAVVPDIKIE